MVRFYLGEGTRCEVQHLLDIWSQSHPDSTTENTELSYQLTDNGKWYILLMCEEEE